MDAIYRRNVNQPDDVDRFLREPTKNPEFWDGLSKPIHSNDSTSPTSASRVYFEQLNNANPADLPTIGSALDSRLGVPVVSSTAQLSLKFHHPTDDQRQHLGGNRLHEVNLPRVHYKGDKKKKSAFKSVRSFFKRHILNNNNTNYPGGNYGKLERDSLANEESLSSASLHDYTKPNCSNSNIVNSADLFDKATGAICTKSELDQQLTRAHSFSASKMRRDSFTNHRRVADIGHAAASHHQYSPALSRPPPSPRSIAVPVSNYYSAHTQNPIMSSSRSSSAAFLPQRSSHPMRAGSSSRLTTTELTDRGKVNNSHSGDVTATARPFPGESDSSRVVSTSYDNCLSSTPVRSNTRENTAAKPMENTITPFFTHDTPCLNGILNHGNTCYMNALVQCLACIDRFAQFFVCEQFNSSHSNAGELAKNSSTNILASILQSLWFNVPADGACLKLLKFMTNESTHFRLSSQQDAQESLIWVLDRIHEEIKDVRVSKCDVLTKQYKSEEQLASDALKRVSGSNNSGIMDLFRAQFRSSMECLSCGFTNLTFDPYMTVSLSVLLQSHCMRSCTALFVPYFNERQITRYHFALSELSDSGETNGRGVTIIFDIKNKIMSSLSGSPDNLIACHFSKNGQCKFLADNTRLNDFNVTPTIEYTMVEMPKLSEIQELQQYLVVAIITHLNGYFPNGVRHGQPYVVVLNRQWSYDRIVRCVLDKASCVLRHSCSPSYNDFKLLMQHSTDGFLHLDSAVTMPLFNQSVNSNKRGMIYRIVVEWNINVANDYLRPDAEPVINDHTFEREAVMNRDSSTTLTNLLQDYIKSETVADWKCPKCLKTSGQKELKFHSIPPVLVFHLKRFELHNDGATRKIDTKVQIPLDLLDMSPYICNPDNRFVTLKARKETNGFVQSTDSYEYPFYDLVGVVRHHGERANSGHYTATTRNPIDKKWRNFDDLKVTLVPQSDETVRTSTDAYLLFYERRKVPPDLINFSDSVPTKSSFRWFPSQVPKFVIDTCEQQRTYSHGSLERRSELLRRELDDCSLRDDKRPVYQSGASTFYTGSGLDPNAIARSYTEQLHNGVVGSQDSHLTAERFGSLPVRRSSMSSKVSNNGYSSAVQNDAVGAWSSNSPRHPSNNLIRSNRFVGTPPHSKVNYTSEIAVPSSNIARSQLYKYNSPVANDERGRPEYKVYSSYTPDYASLADSPRRSKSQYALSSRSSATARNAPMRSPVPSTSYCAANDLNGYVVGYSSSSIGNRSRSSIRGGGGDMLTPNPIKSHHLISSYRH